MMHNLRLILGYLRRPRLYPELWRIARARLAGRLDGPEARETAQRWCAEHALRPDEALARLGAAPTTRLRVRFPDVFADADRRVEECPVPMGSGANLDLLHALAEHFAATRVIETGVAYGWSSLALLLSLSTRGGRLVSNDMPYVERDNDPWVGCAVPGGLRDGWELIRLADGEGLPRALDQVPELDLCHYDSNKRYAARMWAYPLLWRALRPGGCFVSDDIGDNPAFRDFAAAVGLDPLVVREPDSPDDRPAYVGILVKPGERDRP
jgi:predicted O-methyltransferase YrrM